MNERELSLIKVLGEEFGQVLAEMRDSFSKNLQAQREEYEEKLTRLAKQVEEISNAPDPDIESMVKAAIAHLPAPTAPELPDITAMVSDAVAAIPAPRDGKSVTVD
ncbi:phage gp6-like head-tail connector protein, partial [Salmonella enterica]|nr:phage gp6-like head-tail connector protein [Salmonella enterica]